MRRAETIAHQRPVELDDVDRMGPQMNQGGVARPEPVERHADAAALEVAQHAPGLLVGTARGRPPGDLHLDHPGLQAVTVDSLDQAVGEARVLKLEGTDIDRDMAEPGSGIGPIPCLAQRLVDHPGAQADR